MSSYMFNIKGFSSLPNEAAEFNQDACYRTFWADICSYFKVSNYTDNIM